MFNKQAPRVTSLPMAKPAPPATQAPTIRTPAIPQFARPPGSPQQTQAAAQFDDSYLFNQMAGAKVQVPYLTNGRYLLAVAESKQVISVNPQTKGAVSFAMMFLVLWSKSGGDGGMPIQPGRKTATVYKTGVPGAQYDIAASNYLEHVASMYAGYSGADLSGNKEAIRGVTDDWANDRFVGQLLYCEATPHKTRNGTLLSRFKWHHIAEDPAFIEARKLQLVAGETPPIPAELADWLATL